MTEANGAQQHGEGILRITEPLLDAQIKRINESMSKLSETVCDIKFALEIAEGPLLPLKTWRLE